MTSKLKGVFHHELIKVGFLNSFAVGFKIAAMLGINKILAIYVGPNGYAVLGQFQNFIQILTSIGGGAINLGVTKYTAEYEGEYKKQQQLWSTALVTSLVGGILTSLIIISYRVDLSIWLLKEEEYSGVFIWLSVGFVFLVLNAFFLAILNGQGRIGVYVLANISGSISAFFLALYFTAQQGLWGALIAVSLYQAIGFFSTVIIIKKINFFEALNFTTKPDWGIIKNLLKYALMAAIGSLCAPVANMYIRGEIVNSLGSMNAGYWEAMNRLSAGYLLLFTTILSVYYVPKFSQLTESISLKSEIINGYKLLMPCVIFCLLVIYFLQDSIIILLFSKDFLPVNEILLWFLIGDFLKIGGWVLSFLIISKAMVKTYIVLDITFTFIYISLNIFLINMFGLKGAGIAYLFTYLFYWIVLMLIIKEYFMRVNGK